MYLQNKILTDSEICLTSSNKINGDQTRTYTKTSLISS